MEFTKMSIKDLKDLIAVAEEKGCTDIKFVCHIVESSYLGSSVDYIDFWGGIDNSNLCLAYLGDTYGDKGE